MQRKSQAALEFLTTYAWAFIVITIAIAAIIYFGILNPQKILPNRCNFNVVFGCQGYKITGGTSGSVDLRLKNNVGQTITITNMQLSAESATAFSCTTPPTNPANWAMGEVRDLTWSNCNTDAVGFSSGNKGKVLVKITYYDIQSGSTYSQIAQGEIYTAVI